VAVSVDNVRPAAYCGKGTARRASLAWALAAAVGAASAGCSEDAPAPTEPVATVENASPEPERAALAPTPAVTAATPAVAVVPPPPPVATAPIAPAAPTVTRLIGHWDTVAAGSVTAGGDVAVTGSADRTVRLWDVASGKERARFAKLPRPARSAAVAAAGAMVVFGGDDGVLHIWAGRGGDRARTDKSVGKVGSSEVAAVALSSDGALAAVGRKDGHVLFVDTASGKVRREVAAHRGEVNQIVAVPGTGAFLTGGDDAAAAVIDAATGKIVKRLKSPKGLVTAVAAAAGNDRLVAMGTSDGTVRLVDLETSKVVHTFDPASGSGAVTALTFAPDGKELVVAANSAPMRVVEARSGRVRASFEAPTNVVALTMTSETTLIALALDETVRRWTLPPPMAVVLPPSAPLPAVGPTIPAPQAPVARDILPAADAPEEGAAPMPHGSGHLD
jgi:WD40 repeat protein